MSHKSKEEVLALSPEDRFLLFKNDPWEFLMHCVFTLDQVNQQDPIKTLPDREYARIYVRLWQKYPLLAIPKTRRMTMSWFTIGLYVWDTIFHQARHNAFVSKKEDNADELVKRAEFIVTHIPEAMLPKELRPKHVKTFCKLDFPDLHSAIEGFPQGADQLRQFTLSGIFGDECAFWEQGKEFYSASKPTIDGGGRMTLVSSPAPGFFKKIVFDALDEPGEINVEEFMPETQSPMQGLRIWKNQKNKFTVFELHYLADPLKRTPEFKEAVRSSMPIMEYLREYELHWDTFAGFPVYPEWSKLHETREYPFPVAGLPMLIAFDFGLTPAAVVGQYYDETLHIFKEYVEINMGAVRFVDKVTTDLRLRWPTFSDLRKNWLCYIDPSGVNRSDTDESSCALVLAGAGFIPSPGPIAFEDRRKAVQSFLMGMTKNGPKFQIYAAECPVLVKGFEGGYRFSDKAGDIEPTKLRPLKDAYSHPHDALQYLCHGVNGMVHKLRHSIPKPGYSLTQKESRRYV